MLITEFNNEQLITMYYVFKERLDGYEIQFTSKLTSNYKDNVLIVYRITDDDIEFIKKSNDYQTTLSMVNKLKPIVDILADCDDYKKVLAEYEEQ